MGWSLDGSVCTYASHAHWQVIYDLQNLATLGWAVSPWSVSSPMWKHQNKKPCLIHKGTFNIMEMLWCRWVYPFVCLVTNPGASLCSPEWRDNTSSWEQRVTNHLFKIHQTIHRNTCNLPLTDTNLICYQLSVTLYPKFSNIPETIECISKHYGSSLVHCFSNLSGSHIKIRNLRLGQGRKI